MCTTCSPNTHVQVYQPLELLLLIAALCLVADTFMPSLVSVSRVGDTDTDGEGCGGILYLQ